MNRDLLLIAAAGCVGLGIMMVVITTMGPPGSVSRFEIPSPFLQICSTEACLEEQMLKGLKPYERVVGMDYGEGWVRLQFQDGSNVVHSNIGNKIIQEYLDDPYYRHLKRDPTIEYGDDWVKKVYDDNSEELMGGLTKDRINTIFYENYR